MNTPERNFSPEYIAEVRQMLTSGLMIAGLKRAALNDGFDLNDFVDTVMVWFDGRKPQPRDYTSFDHLSDLGFQMTTAMDLASAAPSNGTLTGWVSDADGTVRQFGGPIPAMGELSIASILKMAEQMKAHAVPVSANGDFNTFLSAQALEAAHEALQPWHRRMWRRFKRWASR